MSLQDRIIVALDQPDAASALKCARALAGRAKWVKVGMTLYYSEGPDIVRQLRDLGFDVFIDLKLHDIPHQARGAARVLGALGAGMLTVHASGGRDMIAAAVEGARAGAEEASVPAPAVLAITVLTSIDVATLLQTGVARGPAEQVWELAGLASRAGADGVVCSPQEARDLRGMLGMDTLIVTPGIRPSWAATPDDQARTATPLAAIQAGASHLVIGRPITAADDPAAAFDRILMEE